MRHWALGIGVTLALAGCGVRSNLDVTDGTFPSAIEFGTIDCGSTDDVREVPIDAAGSSFDWSTEVSGPFVVIGPTSGRLESGERASVRVAGNAVQTTHPGEPVFGMLRVRTGTINHDIELHATTRGSEVQIPAVLDFGSSDTSVVKPLVVKNAGGRPVSVRFGDPSGTNFRRRSSLGPDGFAHLNPGASASADYEFYPLASGNLVAKVPVTIDGAACGNPPHDVELRGSANVGAVKVSASTLDFGTVDCGTSAAPQSFTLTNTSDSAFVFNVSVTAGTVGVVSPINGVLDAKETVAIKLSPGTIRSASFPDASLVIKTNAPNDSPHTVVVKVTPRGAVLTFPPKFDLGRMRAGEYGTRFVAVTNEGNASVTVVQTGLPLSPIPTTVPVGKSMLPITLVPLGELAPNQESTGSWVAIAGSLCQDTIETTVTHELYERAESISAADGIVCTVASSGFYCEGYSTVTGIGMQPFVMKTTKLKTVTQASPYRILAGRDGLCANEWCYLVNPVGNTTLAINKNSFFGGGHGAPFFACDFWDCFGRNDFGVWGDPTTGYGSLVVTPSPALGGSGMDGFSSAGRGGFAIRNHLVYAAGYKDGDNLGPTTHADGWVSPYVILDGIADARAVSAFNDGACITRMDGSVTCWAQYFPAADVGGLTDAFQLMAFGPYQFCYRRLSSYGIDCYDNGVVTAVTGIALPIKGWAKDDVGTWIVEDDGRVTRIRPLPMVHMTGFDPP